MVGFYWQSIIFPILLLSINIWFCSGVDHRNPCVNRDTKTVCRDLNYIPVLPANTTSLLLIHFRADLLNRKTLSNLTGLQLKIIEFRQPFWKNITTDVFTDIVHLRTLIIKRLKRLKMLPNLFQSLHFTKIITLRLYQVNLGHLTMDLFKGLSNTSARYLRLRKCFLKKFNGAYLSYLTKLHLLDLSENPNMQVKTWGYLPALTILNLTGSYIQYLPEFQNKSSNGYPELRTLYLSLTGDYTLDQVRFEGLPKLTNLKIQTNGKLTMATETIGSFLPMLRNLSITGTPGVRFTVEEKAIVSSSLRKLRLNNVTISKNSFEKLFYCPNLTTLELSGFRVESPFKLNRILQTLRRLVRLQILNSRLTAIPDAVCHMTNLTRLNLRGNFIYSWRSEDCLVMRNLKQFSLARNDIKKINMSSFSEALWNNSHLMWDLSYNSYHCNCYLLWFRDWLRKTKERVVGYPKGYRCTLLSGISIQISKFELTPEYCLNRFRTPPLIIVGISLGALALIIIACSIVAYVKRWSLRWWCYLLWVRHRKYKFLANNTDYIYDAFVCYSSDDIQWILNKLLPVIEETDGFKLCLHDRDFKPGNDIVDNIMESIQTSRKVVLVLSPRFAESSWCQYEASLAEQRLLEEKRGILVPLLLKEIPTHIQSNRLAILLKRKTYLEWADDENGQKLFWEKLSNTLATPPVYEEI